MKDPYRSIPAPSLSTEDLRSRCGSRQSLLESAASHKSHLSVAGGGVEGGREGGGDEGDGGRTCGHYSNAGCTESTAGALAGSSPHLSSTNCKTIRAIFSLILLS